MAPLQHAGQHNSVSITTPCHQEQVRDKNDKADNEFVDMDELQVALSEWITAFHALNNDILTKCMKQLVNKSMDRVRAMASPSNVDQNDARFLDTVIIYLNSLVQVYHTAKKNKMGSHVSTPMSQVIKCDHLP
ncbi:hypothetical protein BDQ17DRAFT_1424794 [Cyathus striatus]|nr:hypothetical protein BDQ17DRAFT_1424794 [Cyathus striatus]